MNFVTMIPLVLGYGELESPIKDLNTRHQIMGLSWLPQHGELTNSHLGLNALIALQMYKGGNKGMFIDQMCKNKSLIG